MNSGIPATWVETSIGDCFEDIRNGTTATQNGELKGVPVTRIETIQNSKFCINRVQHITNPSDNLIASFRYIVGDIAFSHINSYEHVGKTALYEGSPEVLLHGMNLLRLRTNQNLIEPKFAHFFLQTSLFRDEVRKRVGHAVNQVSINQKSLREVPFVLAPTNEQRRIVKKLGTLLDGVDKCKHRLGQIPAILKRFRQSILAAACSGRLTADWRELNTDTESAAVLIDRINEFRRDITNSSNAKTGTRKYVPVDIFSNDSFDENNLPATWREVRFGSVIGELRNGISLRPNISPPGIKILRISAARPGSVDLSDARYMPDGEKHIHLSTLKNGDLLFTRYNGSLELLGVCGMVRRLGTEVLLYPDKLMRVRFDHPYILPGYAEIYFQVPSVHEAVIAKSKSSAGQNGVSGSDIKAQPFALPPLAEQQEIVRRVESLFTLAEQLEARYKKGKAYVDKLTQSILAKAFRGELVPQDPNDEPADKLLERIRECGKLSKRTVDDQRTL